MENSRFTVAIIGTGLIGGSLGYALKGFRGCLRVGCDADAAILSNAVEKGAIDKAAESVTEAVKTADLSIFCLNPDAVVSEIENAASSFKQGSVVTEICGVKSRVSKIIPELLPDGIHYAGLHPMAGKEVGGFVNAGGNLFRGAGFIIVPANAEQAGTAGAVDLLRELSKYVGTSRVPVNTPQAHDRIIGYTSDLMHIAAAALCGDYPKDMTIAHTAGAYRDCTRIAEIDAKLWAELLLENAGYALPHLDAYIKALENYREAMAKGDRECLEKLLEASNRNKKEMKTL